MSSTMYLIQTHPKTPYQQLHKTEDDVVEGRGPHTSANCEAVSSRLFELLSRRLRSKQSHSCQTWLLLFIIYYKYIAWTYCFMELGNINCSTADCHSEGVIDPEMHILDVSPIWGLRQKAKTAALLFHSAQTVNDKSILV